MMQRRPAAKASPAKKLPWQHTSPPASSVTTTTAGAAGSGRGASSGPAARRRYPEVIDDDDERRREEDAAAAASARRTTTSTAHHVREWQQQQLQQQREEQQRQHQPQQQQLESFAPSTHQRPRLNGAAADRRNAVDDRRYGDVAPSIERRSAEEGAAAWRGAPATTPAPGGPTRLGGGATRGPGGPGSAAISRGASPGPSHTANASASHPAAAASWQQQPPRHASPAAAAATTGDHRPQRHWSNGRDDRDDIVIEPVTSLSPGGASSQGGFRSTGGASPRSLQHTVPDFAAPRAGHPSLSPARSTDADAGSPWRRGNPAAPPQQPHHLSSSRFDDGGAGSPGMARYDDHRVHERANLQRHRQRWAAEGGADADPVDGDEQAAYDWPPNLNPQQHQQQQQRAHQQLLHQQPPHGGRILGSDSDDDVDAGAYRRHRQDDQIPVGRAYDDDEALGVSRATTSALAGSSSTTHRQQPQHNARSTAAASAAQPQHSTTTHPLNLQRASSFGEVPSAASTAQPTPGSRPTPVEHALDPPTPPMAMADGSSVTAAGPPLDERTAKLAAQTRMLFEAVQRYRTLLAEEKARREEAEARVANLEAEAAAAPDGRGPSASPSAADPNGGGGYSHHQAHHQSPLLPGERDELMGRIDVLERQNAMLRDRLLSSTAATTGIATNSFAGSGGGSDRGSMVSYRAGAPSSLVGRPPSRSPAAAAALAAASRASVLRPGSAPPPGAM